jgi:hypothetical protein
MPKLYNHPLPRNGLTPPQTQRISPTITATENGANADAGPIIHRPCTMGLTGLLSDFYLLVILPNEETHSKQALACSRRTTTSTTTLGWLETLRLSTTSAEVNTKSVQHR